MSGQESVFLPRNGSSTKYQDMLSATSAVPSWMKVKQGGNYCAK